MKAVAIGKDGITFDNGKILESYHDQDCCEDVYADWENMQIMGKSEKNFVYAADLDFFENILMSIVPLEDLGFYIVTKQGVCILVSCYNYQNGYYSSDLSLKYGEQYMDISECVQDFIE